jgi:hypothetical protein
MRFILLTGLLLAFPYLSPIKKEAEPSLLSGFKVRVIDSGYYFSLKVSHPRNEGGSFQAYLDEFKVSSFRLSETQEEISFLIQFNSGLLSYEGYKELKIAYQDDGGEKTEHVYSLLGFSPVFQEQTDLSYSIPYCMDSEGVVLKETFSLEENEDFLPPSDLPFYLDKVMFLTCDPASLSYLSFIAYFGEKEVALDISPQKENGLYSLNGGLMDLTKENLSDFKIVLSYSRLAVKKAVFTIPYSTRSVLATEEVNGAIFVFGGYDV